MISISQPKNYQLSPTPVRVINKRNNEKNFNINTFFLAPMEKRCNEVKSRVHIGTQTDFAIADSSTQTDFAPAEKTRIANNVCDTPKNKKATPVPEKLNEGDISCPICDRKYSYVGGLRFHYKQFHNERGNKCFRCKETFKNFPLLISHFKTCKTE